MCDHIQPMGKLRNNTYLVLKEGKSPRYDFFTETEKKDIALVYEWCYYMSFHLGPEWRLGAVYTKGSKIPEDVDYDSFDNFFMIAGDLVLDGTGMHRLGDYRKPGTILTTYSADYFEQALFEPNGETIDRSTDAFRFLEKTFMIVKYYDTVPERMKEYFSSFAEYAENVKYVLETYSDRIFPVNRYAECDNKNKKKKSFSIAMAYYPLVIYRDTPFYDSPYFLKRSKELVSGLDALFPVPGSAWMRFQSDAYMQKTTAVGGFMDPEFFVPAEMLAEDIQEDIGDEELVNMYLPTYENYAELIL